MNRKKPIISESYKTAQTFRVGSPVLISTQNGQNFMLESGDKLTITPSDSDLDYDVSRLYNRRSEKVFQVDRYIRLENGHILKPGDKIRVHEKDEDDIDNTNFDRFPGPDWDNEFDDEDEIEEMRKNLERKQFGMNYKKKKIDPGYNISRPGSGHKKLKD